MFAVGLYETHPEAGYMHADATKLDHQLKFGDGVLWAGDPNLELRMGVLQSPRYHYSPMLRRWCQKGEIMARRYEVYRHCEDGTEQRIGTWRLEEFDRILMDIAPMRIDAPNRTDTLDEIDKHNAKLDDAQTTKLQDNLGEAMQHLAEAKRNEDGPGVTFGQVQGFRDAE